MKLKKIKYFWKIFLFFIFVFYFYKFKEKSQKAIHFYYTEKLNKNLSILFCVSLNAHCDNKTIKYGDFKRSKLKNETMKNLICHLNQNIPKNPKLIIEEAEKWNFLDAFQSKLNNTIKKDILMFDYHLCANYDLIFNLSKEFNLFRFSLRNINIKVFIYQNGNINTFTGLDVFTFYFNKNDKNISNLLIRQIKIQNNSKKVCLKNELINSCSKIYCYKKCFKNRNNDSRLLYKKEDDFLLEVENESTSSVDENCFKECFNNFDGVLYYLISTKFSKRETKYVDFFIDPYSITIKPNYLKTKEFLFLEITGLLSILFGFNFLSFFLNCMVDFVKCLKINKEDLVKKFKIFIFVFTIANLLVDCSNIIQTYKKFHTIKTTAVLYPVKNNRVSISPCFDIKTIINVKKINNEENLRIFFEKNNLFTIEQSTLNFEDLLISSEIKIMNSYQKIILNKKKVKIFFKSELNSNTTKIYKCFFIYPSFDQNLYRGLLGGFFLELKFNKLVNFYFLTSDKSFPDSETNKLYYQSKYTIIETILEKDKSILRCKKYENGCYSQKDCIDKCVLSKYTNKFFKFPLKIPIFSQWYNDKNKKLLFFDLKNNSEINQLKISCKNLFLLPECHKKIFRVKKMSFFKETYQISVHSNRFIKTNLEVLYLDKQELISSILTSFNIWIGLSIPELLNFIFLKFYRKVIFRFNLSLNVNKIFKFFISFLLLFGLSYNLYFLSSEILKQNKIASVEYKFLTDIEYPIVTVCIDYKKKSLFSKKIKLNANFLDKITLSANDVFESVSYLDDNQRIQTQTNFKNFSSSLDNLLELSHFYYIKLKCFKLKYKNKIPFYHFYRNLNNSNNLVINFKSNIKKYYLTLETIKTLSFFNFIKMLKRKNIVYFIKNTLEYKDSYKFLKDFPSFIKTKSSVNLNEAKSYTEFLKKEFKKATNFSTLLLPLDEDYFNLTINDNKFLKFYNTKMKKLEKENVDKSYSVEYFFKNIALNMKTSENKLKLKHKVISIETIIEDKILVENFFLAVLNFLSFWYNLSITDIFSYFLKFLNFIFNFFFNFIFWFIKKK